jgi:iron complex outermembrane recepter protein
VTYTVNPTTTIKAGARRDYFNTHSGELTTFLGAPLATSTSQRDDITNSGFIRIEKELHTDAIAFISLANGSDRPATWNALVLMDSISKKKRTGK